MWRTINDRPCMTSFYLFKNHQFFRRKNNDMTSVRSLRCKICQEIFKDPKSVMTDLSAWGRNTRKTRGTGWRVFSAVAFLCDSKSQFPQLKHLEKPSMYHIGLFDRRATWILFIVLNLRFDADDCLLSHWSTRNGKSMGLSKSHSQLHSRWCPPYAPPGILVYNPISGFNISILIQ